MKMLPQSKDAIISEAQEKKLDKEEKPKEEQGEFTTSKPTKPR